MGKEEDATNCAFGVRTTKSAAGRGLSRKSSTAFLYSSMDLPGLTPASRTPYEHGISTWASRRHLPTIFQAEKRRWKIRLPNEGEMGSKRHRMNASTIKVVTIVFGQTCSERAEGKLTGRKKPGKRPRIRRIPKARATRRKIPSLTWINTNARRCN